MKRSFPTAMALVLILRLSLHAAGPAAPTTDRLPNEISPAPAIIPERRFVISDFGAVGDGKTMNTDAIRKAIAACFQAGGGSVVVPAGTFLTGPVELGSSMALVLEKNATLRASENFADYEQPGVKGADVIANELKAIVRPLISATRATNVAVRGQGIVDGAGQPWWDRMLAEKKAGAPAQGDKRASNIVQSPRPRLVLFSECRRVLVQGVTLKDSPNFHLVPTRCRDVLIEDVTIAAPAGSPNTDGIDPGNSRDVLIRRCNISVGDDNIAFKSNAGEPVLENILVSDCTFGHGHGVSIGSNVGGGVRNLTVQRCSFTGTDSGIRIKSARDRGGIVENIVYRDITMNDVGAAILINLFYFDRTAQKLRESPPVTATTPVVRGVRIANVTVTGAKNAGEIIGLPEMPVANAVLDHVHISAKTGMTIRDATGLKLGDVVIAPERGEALTISHAEYQ